MQRPDQLFQPVLRDGARRDGLAAGGLLGELETSRSPWTDSSSVRGIGVAVMTRISASPLRAFSCECQPLGDAEAVLLVDDCEAEIAEDHIGLEQRVRAGNDLDGARAQLFQKAPRASCPCSRPDR